jgi:hypothetical protein
MTNRETALVDAAGRAYVEGREESGPMADDDRLLYEAALRSARAVMAEVRRARGRSPLDVDNTATPLPRRRRPIAETTTDELIGEMIADRDAALRRAEEARAHLERLDADEAARAWRKNGTGLQ